MASSEFDRYRGSSKFFIIVISPIIFIYFLGHVVRMFMTDGETKVSLILQQLFSFRKWQIFMGTSYASFAQLKSI